MSFFNALSQKLGIDKPWVSLVLVIVLTAIYHLYLMAYNIFFHPLRHYPGPRWNAMSQIPYVLMHMRGNAGRDVLKLHEMYGEVVRLSPSELSYVAPQAWKDIMGHRKNDFQENGKNGRHAARPFPAPNIVSAGREDHRRFRRILSHSFSAQAMWDQQPLILKYVDLLISQLHNRCQQGSEPVDMVAWYNYTTFDIIGDLVFGESFACLEIGGYHPWVSLIFDSVKKGTFLRCANYFPWVKFLLPKLIPRQMLRKRVEHQEYTRTKVAKRISSDEYRADFMDIIIKHKNEGGIAYDEIESNANVLIVAGSETTATALSGATYYCLRHPEVYAKLKEEIRSSFAAESEIDLLSVSKLRYTHAVIEEALRIYPPVPTAQVRLTPPQGSMILGNHVPGNTTLGIWQWAVYHNPQYFKSPEVFDPERWLGNSEYDSDCKESFNPFHIGSRNCLGRNLAYAEMRLILARVIYNFDMELSSESIGWPNHKMYTLWEKPPLKVSLIPVKRQDQVPLP